MKYLIETHSVHRMVYCIEADTAPTHADVERLVRSNELIEVGQEWLGEQVADTKIVSDDMFVESFDKYNPHLSDIDKEEKMAYVTTQKNISEGTVEE